MASLRSLPWPWHVVWRIFKSLTLIFVLLLLATVTARMKLLGVLQNDWADYAWGVSQNITAAVIMLVLEGMRFLRSSRTDRALADLRKTVHQVMETKLAKIEQSDFYLVRCTHQQLADRASRMMSDAVQARLELSNAINRVDGAFPELVESKIELTSGGTR